MQVNFYALLYEFCMWMHVFGDILLCCIQMAVWQTHNLRTEFCTNVGPQPGALEGPQVLGPCALIKCDHTLITPCVSL